MVESNRLREQLFQKILLDLCQEGQVLGSIVQNGRKTEDVANIIRCGKR